MQYYPGDLLHVYNRGNNKQQIFFTNYNYSYFLNQIRKHMPADIVAYCLMPNHFHFLLQANEESCKPKNIGSLVSTELHNGFRMAQSSYTKAINKLYDRTGSLFQQNTKYKTLNPQTEDPSPGYYAEVCFHYIHQNPLKASLVTKLEDWPHSSFNEYMHNREGICRKDLAHELFRINPGNFYKASCEVIDSALLKKII